MNKLALLALTTGTIVTLAVAFDAPPAIPSGDVSYDSITFEEVSYTAPAPAAPTVPPPASGLLDDGSAENWYSEGFPAAPTPVSSVSSDATRLKLLLNAYSSNYNVRGMGVTNNFSEYGYSSIDATYTFPNRNLFGWGLYHQINAALGIIWDDGCELGETPIVRGGYAIGKEIFPNLNLLVGYSIQHGGLEGYMAKKRDKCSTRTTQQFYTSLEFNDHQRGFFGGSLFGVGVQGLTGYYWDNYVGYRMTDLLNGPRIGLDLEVIAGLTYSSNYWTGRADGIDAYRIRANFLPFTQSGSIGRDARTSIIPWVQVAFAGNNEKKIKHDFGCAIIDKAQLTVGCDVNWKF